MDAIDTFIDRMMDPAVRDRLFKRRGMDPSPFEPKRASRSLDSQITTAGNILGFAIPPSYRKLVITCDESDVALVADVLWVGQSEGVGLVKNNHPSSVPDFLISFQSCGDGDEICFDTRKPDARGEYPIIRWKHEVNAQDDPEDTEYDVLAEDLGVYLLSLLPKDDAVS